METLETYLGCHPPMNIYSSDKKYTPTSYSSTKTSHSSTNHDPPYSPIITRAEIVLKEEAARELLEELFNSHGTLTIEDIKFNSKKKEPNLTVEALWALSAVGAITCNGYSWNLTAWGFKRAAILKHHQ